MQRLRGGAQRRLEIGHHDRASEAPRRIGEHRGHRRSVAQMYMEIVRPPEGDAVHRGEFYLARSSALRYSWFLGTPVMRAASFAASLGGSASSSTSSTRSASTLSAARSSPAAST